MNDQPSPPWRSRRLLAPAPTLAAMLVLLVGAVLPATPPPRAGAVPSAVGKTAEATPTVELPPASVTEMPEPTPPPSKPLVENAAGRQALLAPSPWSVPDVLLAAYRRAVAGAPPGCHLPVSLLAAIGQVESGSLAGRSLDAANRAVPPVLGPVLAGVDTAAISDTDGGRLDGNARWDRAVGPMQFIPGTWAAYGVDGDRDGRADPQNVYDATAAAAGYLCAGGRDLALASDLRSAILAYNHSTAYLATVLAWQQRFSGSGVGTIKTVVGTTQAVIDNNNGLPKLLATASAASRTVQLTPSHKLAAHTAAKLAFTTAPSPTALSSTSWDSQPVVTVQDATGNTVTTDTSAVTTDTSTVTLTLTAPDGATLTCDTNPMAAVAGIARFTGCAIDIAGTYTLTATKGPLTSTSSEITITSAASAAAPAPAPSPAAAPVDPAPATAPSPAAAPVDPAPATAPPTPAAAAAAKLAFTTDPSSTAISDTAWDSQPVVTILDAAGNTVTTDTSTVTLTLTTPDGAPLTTPDGATLTCDTNPTAAVAGIVRFTGCAIDKAGTYTLTATSGPLTSTSSEITITAGAPATLAFNTAPSPTAISDTAWDRQPVVAILDAAGNTVTTDTSPVTLALTTPDGATLTCDTNPMAAVAGIARFTRCAIDKAGTYTLTAIAAGLTSTASSSISITATSRAKRSSPHPPPS